MTLNEAILLLKDELSKKLDYKFEIKFVDDYLEVHTYSVPIEKDDEIFDIIFFIGKKLFPNLTYSVLPVFYYEEDENGY